MINLFKHMYKVLKKKGSTNTLKFANGKKKLLMILK